MNKRAAIRCSVVFACALLAGCGLFDSGIEWRDGHYALTWIDLPDEITLSYDLGNGAWASLIAPRVFAVGSNQEYVVAKQHPGGDKAVTNYFIVDRRQDVIGRDSKTALVGPLSEKEYADKSLELRLPAFTKVLESLK